MKARGETLIIVPCWWVGDTERYLFFSSLLFPSFFSFFFFFFFACFCLFVAKGILISCNSLQDSVAFHRPDLFSDGEAPIALNAPSDYFKSM